MAITVNLYYKGANGNARKFAQEMIASGTVDKIRAKEGNLRYEYFYPVEDTETVLLIDSWKDQKALDGEGFSKIQRHFVDAITLAMNNDRDLSGIVINAFSEPFVLDKEIWGMVQNMKSRIEDN